MPSAAFPRRTVAHALAAGLMIVAVGTLTAQAAAAVTPDVALNSAAPSIGITPDSANGCASSVCIYVTGTGLHVSDWTTSVALSRSMCSTASFLVNGVLWASGVNQCGRRGKRAGVRLVVARELPERDRVVQHLERCLGQAL